MEMLERVAYVRHEREDIARHIRASYDTYTSPKMDKAAPKSGRLSDSTAQSMYRREGMIERYKSLIGIEAQCWEAVRAVQDPDMRQLITRCFLIGSGKCNKRNRTRIRNYLQEMEKNQI